MRHNFISYARATHAQPPQVAEALRAIAVVLVLLSAKAAKLAWARSKASRARAKDKLAQITLDKSPLPIPSDQIQRARPRFWNGAADG